MLDWVKKIYQEKKLEVFVSKKLVKKKSSDEIELEEMVRVRSFIVHTVFFLNIDQKSQKFECSQKMDLPRDEKLL